MLSPALLLTGIIFLPSVFALVLPLFDGKNKEAMRYFALFGTLLTFVLTVMLWMQFDPSQGGIQAKVSYPWIVGWNINYTLGVDGISLPLVLLTGLVSALAMMASWSSSSGSSQPWFQQRTTLASSGASRSFDRLASTCRLPAGNSPASRRA